MKWDSLKIGNLEAKVPIIQGGMGVGISLSGLASAVAKEGGIGLISAAQIGFKEEDFATNTKEANLRAIKKEFEKAKTAAPDGIIGFNMMVAMKYYEDYVKAGVDAGADVIVSGAGLPLDLPEYIKGSACKIAPIVSTEKSAKIILKYWDRKYGRTADFVVIEGPKAGGHLGFTNEQLKELSAEAYEEEVSGIIKLVKQYEEKYDSRIPVVLAGGIDDRDQVSRAFALGAQGVQVGSPFVTTVECDADMAFKQRIIDATEDDIAVVTSPVGMPGRAIVNSFMKDVISGKKFTPTRCYQCLSKCNPKTIPYCITERLVAAAKGDVEDALLFCGANSYKAKKITTVKEVIDSLMN